MANEDRLFNKLDALEASIVAHSEKSMAFQSEVMDVLKGSFEGNEWRPGIAPLLREQIARIDALEEHAKSTTQRRITWWHGVAVAVLGALIGKVSEVFHFTR
jgi:hypothetical protein